MAFHTTRIMTFVRCIANPLCNKNIPWVNFVWFILYYFIFYLNDEQLQYRHLVLCFVWMWSQWMLCPLPLSS